MVKGSSRRAQEEDIAFSFRKVKSSWSREATKIVVKSKWKGGARTKIWDDIEIIESKSEKPANIVRRREEKRDITRDEGNYRAIARENVRIRSDTKDGSRRGVERRDEKKYPQRSQEAKWEVLWRREACLITKKAWVGVPRVSSKEDRIRI